MIEKPEEVRATLFGLGASTWTLAAVGVMFESGLADQLVEPRSVDELAERCASLSRRRIHNILALVATTGLVSVDGSTYRLASGVVPLLAGPLRAAVEGDIRTHLAQPLAFLDRARDAAPAAGWSHTDSSILKAQGASSGVLPGMLKAHIVPALDDLASRLDREDAGFLDVGTGVGAIAIGMCRAFPNVHVLGLDVLEAPLAIARANVAKEGLDGRVRLEQRAVQELRQERPFDLAWVPAFFLPAVIVEPAVARVHAALRDGGWVLFAIGSQTTDPRDAAVFALIDDVWGGGEWTVEAAIQLLSRAGFRGVRRLPGPPSAPAFIVGQRQK
jgi:hypothetical protein